MPRPYTLSQYVLATEALAEHHGVEVRTYQNGGKAILFRVFLKSEKTVPIEMWAITTTGGTNAKIASSEYLKRPALHINQAQQKEFDAIIEMLPE